MAAAVSADSETARYLLKAEAGLLAPPEDPAALADAVRRLYRDEGLRERLGGNGRRLAEATFARQQVLDRYAELIESLGKNHAA